jgi:hypothetical protein
MKTANFAVGAIRATEMVSGWLGVTTPLKPTRAFRKTNFVFALLVASASATDTVAIHASAASATPMWVPLPADTKVTIAGDGQRGKDLDT